MHVADVGYKKKGGINMHDVELNDSDLLLICEILRTDVQASLSILRDERDFEHARSVVERIVKCNILLKGLE